MKILTAGVITFLLSLICVGFGAFLFLKGVMYDVFDKDFLVGIVFLVLGLIVLLYVVWTRFGKVVRPLEQGESNEKAAKNRHSESRSLRNQKIYRLVFLIWFSAGIALGGHFHIEGEDEELRYETRNRSYYGYDDWFKQRNYTVLGTIVGSILVLGWRWSRLKKI